MLGGVAAIGVTLHAVVPDASPLVVAAHASVGWWWPATVLALVFSAVRRDRIGVVLGAITTLAVAGWTVPGTLGRPSSEPAVLRVAVSNLLSSNPQIDHQLDDVLAENPDVVALIEVPTTLDTDRLDAVRWPVRRSLPREDNFGIALFAPAGASPVEVHRVGGVPWLTTTLQVGGLSVEVLAAHTLPPMTQEYHRRWTQQLRWLARRQADGQPRLVLADLNLTRHNPTFATLRRSGLLDAFASAGTVASRTWTPLSTGPALLRLDHVLHSRQLAPTAIRVLPRRGSDHCAVVGDLALSVGP